ncbi:hypothetical protein LZ198_03020 [Myxococcus sp. K15C18031901]|uniref:hypothetical protein n=1 Tax=Myxococcus dinghuensis TaxID=2906761 RepID=UPI0020A7F837|nr:hypothetical protein [Myxococcus dinghuensis]MCP3097842.1 hypothetical protein [Myxococcus dinghuensis]
MRRWLSRLTLLRLALPGCRSPPNADARFWHWFERNSARLLQSEAGQDPLLDELHQELLKAHPGLTFELGPLSDGHRELAISVDGTGRRFTSVKTLVAAAPALPGWRVVAFRRRKGADFAITLGKVTLKPEDVWFRAETQPRQPVEVSVYLNGFTEDDRPYFSLAAYLVLDDVLGEYDVETKVGGIGFEAFPKNPVESGLRPIAELAAVVDGNFAPEP